MKKIYYLMVVLWACVVYTYGQGISVSAPSNVSTGENFRVSYTINTQNVDDFRAASVPSGLEVIAGPYTSKQSSYQFVNGHTSSSSSITYTYTLYADKAGTYTIPGAHARVNGKSVSSHPVRIKVSGSAKRNNGSPVAQDDDFAQMSNSGRITGNDLFVKVSANKKRVHEQEPVLLTYKVYTLVDLTSLDGKMPELTGFHTQEVPLPQQKSFHMEKLNGKNYRCVTWSQYVMFPQMTGKLSIPSITFKGIVVQRNRTVDPFEAFLNGGSGYEEVKRNIVAPGLDIQVDPLPQKPVGFSGGVGHFTITAQLNHSTVKEGEPLTLRVVVGGIGNLKLIKQPVVDFPKDFDRYDPKVTDKTRLTANGIEGNVIYDYLVVPRNRGEYTIPEVALVYYDTSSSMYKTIKTQPVKVIVEKGDGNGSSVNDYSDENSSDIKSIKKGRYSIYKENDLFFGSLSYWICYIVPVIIFVILIGLFRKKAEENADKVGTRGKRANKVATKRLKKAYKLKLAGKQTEFFDEVLRALWGYVSDKMNMPVEKLSRENISESLLAIGISSDTVDCFINALDECEFERYAPGDVSGNMTKTYDTAMNAIMDIENSFKTSKKNQHTANSVLFVGLVIICFTFGTICHASAITKENADTEYLKGNFQQAMLDYNELLKSGESAELYYNIGNCYYRLGNVPQSIIAYEKAKRLSPSDGDIRSNLAFVQTKTIDKIVPMDDMFFIAWLKYVVNMMNVDGWATFAVLSFVATLAFIMLFFLGNRIWIRKTGFFCAVIFLVFCISGNSLACYQRKILYSHNSAVVISATAIVKKTPSDTGEEAFVIHEGTSVDITDKTMKEWYSVRVADGKEGWIKKNQLEVI